MTRTAGQASSARRAAVLRRWRRQRSKRRLVRMLRVCQREEGLTVVAMAERLGVSASSLCMVYNGRRSPGPLFLRGVLRSFPELRDEVCRFLLASREDASGEEESGDAR